MSTPISRHWASRNWGCERSRCRPGNTGTIYGGDGLRLVSAPCRRLLPVLRHIVLGPPDRHLSRYCMALGSHADALAGGGEHACRAFSFRDRKSTRLHTSHVKISYAVFS